MKLLQEPFAWYIAGPLLALNLFLLFYLGERFGVSRSFRTACSMLGAGAKTAYFNYEWKKETWLLIYLSIGDGNWRIPCIPLPKCRSTGNSI